MSDAEEKMNHPAEELDAGSKLVRAAEEMSAKVDQLYNLVLSKWPPSKSAAPRGGPSKHAATTSRDKRSNSKHDPPKNYNVQASVETSRHPSQLSQYQCVTETAT